MEDERRRQAANSSLSAAATPHLRAPSFLPIRGKPDLTSIRHLLISKRGSHGGFEGDTRWPALWLSRGCQKGDSRIIESVFDRVHAI